jgi:glutamate-5-semialdehyde dehydrogenase
MTAEGQTAEGFTREAAARARAAGQRLAAAPVALRSAVLRDLAAALAQPAVRESILAANALDLQAAQQEHAAGRLAAPLLKRLALDAAKLDGLSDGLGQLAAREEEDAVYRVTLRRELDTGLLLTRESCPLGLLGVVFESRPDALIQIAGLALRSGNAALLKGGREALRTSRALAEVVGGVLARHGVPREAVLLLEDRAAVETLLGLSDLVDLIIARGSSEFIAHVRRSTQIPVMGHDAGVCHLYLHRSADAAMAAALAVDGKCSYPAACNATETLLWEAGAEAALEAAVAALRAAGVELRADAPTRVRHPQLAVARDEDWDAEYGALILSIKQVDDLSAALLHIARHGTGHTEAIVAQDAAAAERFLREVDAACVLHNASTRFSDGYRFGLGAEVGISTDKLHARGPVGVDGLYTYRWLLRGQGQVSAAYGAGGSAFLHRTLPLR